MRSLLDFFVDPVLRAKQRRHRQQSDFARDGLLPSSRKVAIFLIFQPQGIAESTLLTCRHLCAEGYAPLLVLNSPASTGDMHLLAQVSWKITCRENFGYDFGGYQDAIWFLQQTHPSCETLLILNDSIWFPVQEDLPLLKEMESQQGDFTGALQLGAHRASISEGSSKPAFYGSFLLHFKSGALRHPAFIQFWRDYKATSNKYVTIRRGERGLSRSLIDGGVSHGYLHSRRIFDRWLAALPAAQLKSVLRDLISMNAEDEKKRDALALAFDGSDRWAAQAEQLAYDLTEKQNILSSAPIASLEVFRVPYIKKSADPHNLRALTMIETRCAEGSLTLDPIVRSEIQQVLDRARQIS